MDIKIRKGAHVCASCERSFVHEEEFHSLVRIEEQTFLREDYCTACWQPSRAASAYSAWSPRYYDPKVAEQEPPEVFSPLRQTFYEAVESNSRNVMAMAYLAAQLLRRQKVFRLIKESDDPEGELNVALFADRIGNRLIEVRDPSLSYGELEEGRRLLMEHLNALENPEEESSGEAEDAQIENPGHAESQEEPAKN